MQTISYTSARTHLAKTMEHVCEDHAPVIITRANAKPVIMISLEDFEAMEETNYLLKNPMNAARLASAVDEIEAMISAERKKEK